LLHAGGELDDATPWRQLSLEEALDRIADDVAGLRAESPDSPVS
jgi:hypothetical protein